MRNATLYAAAIALGAVLPDFLIIVFYGFERLSGVPEQVIWNQHYYRPFWQNLFDIANSIPIFLILVGIGIALNRKSVVLFFHKRNNSLYFRLSFSSP